jgi:hypothetical protein
MSMDELAVRIANRCCDDSSMNTEIDDISMRECEKSKREKQDLADEPRAARSRDVENVCDQDPGMHLPYLGPHWPPIAHSAPHSRKSATTMIGVHTEDSLYHLESTVVSTTPRR